MVESTSSTSFLWSLGSDVTSPEHSEIRERSNSYDSEKEFQLLSAESYCYEEEEKVETASVPRYASRKRLNSKDRSPRQIRRNERERGRKARLNAAFKVLRNVVPFYADGLNKEKLTQVQILRLASRYINNLTNLLSERSQEELFYPYSNVGITYPFEYNFVHHYPR